MTPPSSTKRPVCHTCLRPQRTCICQWITPTDHLADVVILQHPLEVDNAKGSARLLHLSLPDSTLVTGESFDEERLQALINAPGLHATFPAPGKAPTYAVLLYPDMPKEDALVAVPPPAVNPELLAEPARLRLIVLDATWRKSRKMLHVNPLLQRLPRLALQDVTESRYSIRKAHLPHQLSTLEATCHALAQLERNSARYQPLLVAFEGFVAQQASYVAAREEGGRIARGRRQ